MAVTGSNRSRLRLIVIQALVFSLFVTLFARLYYLQVVVGDSYQAQAASQSLREIVQQPQRGLIVDAQGRPLVTNRTSWVVSIDNTMLGKLTEAEQRKVAGLRVTVAEYLSAGRPHDSGKLVMASPGGPEWATEQLEDMAAEGLLPPDFE